MKVAERVTLISRNPEQTSERSTRDYYACLRVFGLLEVEDFMTWESDRQLVASLAREVVRYAGPDELSFFDATSDAFFDAPKRARRAHRDEPLGFGLEATFTVITTLALTVTADVLKQLAEGYAQRVIDKAVPRARVVLKKWFRRPPDQSVDPLPNLNQDQVAEIRELAYRRARELRASEEQATLIADGIAKALVARSALED